MMRIVFGMAVVIGGLAHAPVMAQAPAQPPAPADPPVGQTPAPAPAGPAAGQAPATGQTPVPARGGMKVGQTGNPDPGVNFVVVIDNPHVRVLQVTLQPGAVRRPHVHNDVTFHMMVPVTGSLDLTIEKNPVVTTIPGQAYYMTKGQTHSFTNKSSAAVQVIELFMRPEPVPTPPPAESTAAPGATSKPTTAPATTPPPDATKPAPDTPPAQPQAQ